MDRLSKYLASLPCFVLFVLLLATTTKVLAVKAGTAIDQPVCLPALLAHLFVLCLLLVLDLVEVDFLPTYMNMPRAIYFN